MGAWGKAWCYTMKKEKSKTQSNGVKNRESDGLYINKHDILELQNCTTG